LDVADSPENQEEFGIYTGDRGRAAFPKIRFVTLVENGTRVMFGAAFGPYAGPKKVSEIELSWQTIKSLKSGMLCLADRYYLGFKLWTTAAESGAQLLWRVKNRHIFEAQKILPDGSYLSKIYPSVYDRETDRNGISVRVIEYKFKWQREEDIYRLITTVLDHQLAPAEELAGLYHERWTIETAFAELKTVMRGADVVLRSKTPELAKQEFYAFLLSYFAVRGIMHEAAYAADEAPSRLSFIHSINVIRRKLPAFGTFPPAALG
jgi:IS4 transposase